LTEKISGFFSGLFAKKSPPEEAEKLPGMQEEVQNQTDIEEEPEVLIDTQEEDLTVVQGGLPSTIPGISYQNQEGENKLFVIPFMKDISELEGLVYIPSQQDSIKFNPVRATIRISAKAESGGLLFQDTASDIADALGGGDGEAAKSYDYIPLLEKEISLPSLSLDAIEVGYLEAGTGKGKRYTAVLSTTEGIEAGTGIIDSGENPLLGISIEVVLPSGTFSHESPLSDGEAPNKLYHSIAINLPDLPEDSVKILENASDKAYKAAENPDSLSALKWYGRNILNRSIAAQTTFDAEQRKNLNIILGRTDKERCLVLTSRMGKDNKLYSTMDLLQAINQVHNGDKSIQASYNIVAGLFASSLESAALTGDNKAGYLELWSKTPKDTSLVLILNDEEREQTLAEMQKAGHYPFRLLDRVANSDMVILVPDKPGEYNGQKRWAWLEIDPETYATISVIDTGEHAGMASYAMSLMPSKDDYGQYIVGALIGVDVAVWAVCSSSLKLDDYKEILKDAKATAEAVANNLDYVMQAYSTARDKEFSMSAGGKGFPLSVGASIGKDGFKVKASQSFVSFTEGFKDGVKIYFSLAK
jgi:hypothetical protein